jgi:hypothetical protein
MFLKSKSQTMQQTRCGEKGSIPEPRSPENKAVIKRKRVRGRSQANEKQSNATIDATLDCAIQLANMNQNEEKGASATDAAELHWSEVKKDRNRLNAKNSRDRQQHQSSALEAQNTRLAVSNDALRFHNRHLREAIQQIKEQSKLKKASAAQPSTMLISSNQVVGGQSVPNQLSQNQHAVKMMASESTKGEVARSLQSSNMQVSHGNQGPVRWMQAPPMQVANVPSSQFLTTLFGSGGDYCCAVYQMHCVMRGNPNINIQNPIQGRQHHALCPNNMYG